MSAQEKITTKGQEIEHLREQLSLNEMKEMLGTYGLDGETPVLRAEKLRSIDPQNLALFMTDLNRRTQGSDDSLIHEKVMKIGDVEAIEPSDRYDVFIEVDRKIQESDPQINPERLGDALALTTVLLHPFKDGNGRTARVLGFIYRDDFDAEDAESSFNQLAESRDDVRARNDFVINGYIPYMIEGSDQSNPKDVIGYIDSVLHDDKSYLYTGPYGQAPLVKEMPVLPESVGV